jgi:hypothetical protein
MVWRVADSLVTLRDQINTLAPDRDKSSDGTIGDQSHQARKSDHNPNAAGVVQAMDITNDPAHGLVSRDIAELLRLSQDRRIKYVISNRQIFSSTVSPWQWRPYTGVNAHTKHVHISVVDDPKFYDDSEPWALERLAKVEAPAATSATGPFTDIVATVFGGHADFNPSAYDGHVIDDRERGVALPARFRGPRPKVRVTNKATRKSVDCDIVDIGPWNTNDPYWETNSRPQAESGVNISGKETNLAGIDLTPGAADVIGLAGKGKVDWEFVTPVSVSQKLAQQQMLPTVAQLLQTLVKNGGTKMPVPAQDVSALLQQLFKLLANQSITAAPGPAPAPTAPGQPPAGDTDDAAQKIIDAIVNIIAPAVIGKGIPLGQVNGALGDTIGRALDGKKTAIGIIGSLLMHILPVLSANGALPASLPALGAGFSGIGLPIFLAITAWGVLGKLEKWAQGNVAVSK